MEQKIKLSSRLEKVVDVIGEIFGFFTLLLIALLLINNVTGNWLGADVVNILYEVREWAIIVVVALAGLELALKMGWFAFIVYGVIVAAVIILMFFPSAWPFAVV